MKSLSGYGATESDKHLPAHDQDRAADRAIPNTGSANSGTSTDLLSERPVTRLECPPRIEEMNGSLRNDCGKLYTAMYYFVAPVLGSRSYFYNRKLYFIYHFISPSDFCLLVYVVSFFQRNN